MPRSGSAYLDVADDSDSFKDSASPDFNCISTRPSKPVVYGSALGRNKSYQFDDLEDELVTPDSTPFADRDRSATGSPWTTNGRSMHASEPTGSSSDDTEYRFFDKHFSSLKGKEYNDA